MIERFSKAEVDSVYLFVNEFKSVMSSQSDRATRILPIEVPKSPTPVDYIYEQKPEEMLGSLLPRYVKRADLSGAAGIRGGGAGRAHDGDGRGDAPTPTK